MSKTAMAIVAAAAVWSAGWAGAADQGTLTIVGRGSGPAKVIGKDGAVEKVSPESMELLNLPQAAAPAPQAAPPAEPVAEQAPAENAAAVAKAEEEARQAEEAVEARRRAEEERRKTDEKEFRRYADKDYTYGPGSAAKEDQTGKVLENKRGSRRAAGPSARPRNVRVGGETRIRVNVQE